MPHGYPAWFPNPPTTPPCLEAEPHDLAFVVEPLVVDPAPKIVPRSSPSYDKKHPQKPHVVHFPRLPWKALPTIARNIILRFCHGFHDIDIRLRWGHLWTRGYQVPRAVVSADYMVRGSVSI